MVNAVVLKTTGFRLVGSTPTLGTNQTARRLASLSSQS